MGPAQSTTAPTHQLPWVVGMTIAVVGFPMLLVSSLRTTGVLTSTPILIVIGILVSVAASQLGAMYWASSSRAGDTVFGDLMLWGWLRRRRSDRQIASASALFAPKIAAAKSARQEAVDVKGRQRILQQLATTLEARDPATQGHSRRVARHAAAIAKALGLPDDEVAKIRVGAALHDVGKISTPVSLLNKPGKLTDEEFAVIQQHPVVGAEAVASLGDNELVGIVRHHHERIDGRGYPDGLKGDEIPLGARIVAVADTFDAVTSPRPYRSAKRHRDALLVLDAVAGTQLDADVVRAFRSYYSGLRALTFWAFALNGPRQLLVSLFDQAKLGGVQMTGAATAATVATVVAGGVAVHSATTPSEPARAPEALSSGLLAPSPSKLVSDTIKKAPTAHRVARDSPRAVRHSTVASNGRARGVGRQFDSAGAAAARPTSSPASSNASATAGSTSSTPSTTTTSGRSGSHSASILHKTSSTVRTATATVTHQSAVSAAGQAGGSATAAAHAVVPDIPPAPNVVDVPDQANAVGLETKAPGAIAK